MKIFNIFISCFLTSSLSWGNSCPQSSGLAKKWQDQKNWSTTTLTPSKNNPALTFQAHKDQNNQIYMAPINVTGSYKTDLFVSINSIYKSKKFAEYCANSEDYGSILTSARKDESNQNIFRMTINYLPSPAISSQNPYVVQNFVSDTDGIGVVLLLREDSLIKKSEAWSFTKVAAAEMGEKISRDLQNQISKGITGSVTLNLNGMDDLACDLLKGNAQIRFFHRGKMDDAKATVVEEVLAGDLWNLYEELTQALAPHNNKEQRLFAAGATWMQNSHILPSVGQEPMKALRLIEQMTNLAANPVMKPMSEESMDCLALDESKFKMNKFNALVSLEVSTQSLTEMQLMSEQQP